MRLLFYFLLFIKAFLAANDAAAQSNGKPLDSLLYMLDRNEFEQCKAILKKVQLDTLTLDHKSIYYLAQSRIAINERKGAKAYEYILTAKRLNSGKQNLNTFMANEMLIDLAAELTDRNINVAKLMTENCAIADYLNRPKLKFNCLFSYFADEMTAENDMKALQIGYRLKNIAVKNSLLSELEGLESNLGTIHYFMKNNDSAIFYYSRALERRKQKADTASIILHLNNYARIQESLGDVNGAFKSFNEAELLLKKFPKDDIRAAVFKGKASIYEQLGNNELAIAYLKKYSDLKDSLNDNTLALEIAELQSKYNTVENEKENAILTARNSDNQKQIYLLFLIITIAGATALVYVIHKNRREKLLIAKNEAQQEKESKLLKEQELVSINAMVEGREKERIKISQELHDDLGSNLTTVRVYLENAVEKVQEDDTRALLFNAHDILAESYNKVRAISHLNSGHTLSEGNLIVALQKLTSRISKTGNLDVEFVYHNMSKPLKNSLEISLYRTIQELLNNTLKHAKATEATVSITGYDHLLDITVEDNGVGFNKNKASNSVGLAAIESRIQELTGVLSIDTAPGKGTTINIEIPIV